jgi:Flp pilus assembly pilin Flp
MWLVEKEKSVWEQAMTFRWVKNVIRFLNRDEGTAAVEYAVLLSLICGVCMASVSAVGNNESSLFSKVSGMLVQSASSDSSQSSGSTMSTSDGSTSGSQASTSSGGSPSTSSGGSQRSGKSDRDGGKSSGSDDGKSSGEKDD